jgi:hypothetical protein
MRLFLLPSGSSRRAPAQHLNSGFNLRSRERGRIMLRFFKNLSSNFNTNKGATARPVVSETTVEAYLDTVSGKSRENDPVQSLVAHARRCANLVERDPQPFSPVDLAHTVAAVVAALAQMGEVTSGYVVKHWSRIGNRYAEPAASHLWEALDALALTAGLMDVAVPVTDTLHHAGNAVLDALTAAAEACADAVCTAEGEPACGPADVARAIAQTLSALAPVFGQVQAWVVRHVPGRGRELPETARRHLHEATGRWAPIGGLIAHVPADPRPEPETALEAEPAQDSEPEVATKETSSDTEEVTYDYDSETGPQKNTATSSAAPKRAKKATKKQR